MSKRQLIDAIVEINKTAAPEFLLRFKERDLAAYLQRMRVITAPRSQQPTLAQR